MNIRRLGSALGAEITNFDIRTATPVDVRRIKELLVEHGVLFFPQQTLTPKEHVKFGSFFGPLESHPNLVKNHPNGHREIFELKSTSGGIANEWHTDLTFQPQPSLMSVLHMVECPSIGGDTLWSSLSAAYDALSPPLQDLCEGLTALHDADPHNRADKTWIHPVVRIHPVSGRKCLYVSEHFTRRIVELRPQESQMLLVRTISDVLKGKRK